MNFVYSAHDFTTVVHICVLCSGLLLGSFLRAKIPFLRKMLIPASMIGGFLLLFFYNFAADGLNLKGGPAFLGELMFHLLNISFIAIQLRIPEKKTKTEHKLSMWQNVCAMLSQYGLQCFFGILVVALFFKTLCPGAARSLGLTLCLGFELGPGQALSISEVWQNIYNVPNATDVGLTMSAIGFLIGSVVGMVFINTAAKKGWMKPEYVEKLRNRKTGNGFFKLAKDRESSCRQTTSAESIDTFSFHLALILFTYLLSFLAMAGLQTLLEFLCGKDSLIVEAVEGLWGVNFVMSSVCAVLVRKILCACKVEYVIDNGTCNRIDGIAVDFTVTACLGAVKIAALAKYWNLILALAVTGIIITCVVIPFMSSRLFNNYTFFRFLMVYGTATGTLPTALSLLRVVDPDFETPAASDYANAMGIVFFLALPIFAFVNNIAKTGSVTMMLIVTGAYILVSFVMYLLIARKRAFAKPDKLFYTQQN